MNRSQLAQLIRRAKLDGRLKGESTSLINEKARDFLSYFPIPKNDKRTELHKVRCTYCDKMYNLLLKEEDLIRYWRKENSPDILFPYLDSDELKLLTDKICKSCNASSIRYI